jgi:DNA-damage-inducible protein J
MVTKTSMLHIRVNTQVKIEAAEKLARFGLTVSDAVRILLTRVAVEGALPVELTTDPTIYDAWFRAKVQEALQDTRPGIPHDQVMEDIRTRIEKIHVCS